MADQKQDNPNPLHLPKALKGTLPLGSTPSQIKSTSTSSAQSNIQSRIALHQPLSIAHPTSQASSKQDGMYRSHFAGPEGPSPEEPVDLALQVTLISPDSETEAATFSSHSSTFDAFRYKALRTTVLPRLAEQDGSATPVLLVEERERYESARPLGQGAMGDVELVYDRDISRFVALKRLKQELHTPPPMLRFAEEVRTVGQLEHPNIIPIHDVGLDTNGQYYFVMKFVEGDTLEEIIQRLRNGDPETHQRYTFVYRTQVFYDILKALEFAHSKGIIHRDIKPANIMIGTHGEVMVMDWGIAKQLPPDRPLKSQNSPTAPTPSLLENLRQNPEFSGEFARYQTHGGVLMGTPAYMSPEQAAGHNAMLDERSDIYSLCVLFYELMTLEHYMGHKRDFHELLFGIMTEAPKTPFGLRHPHQKTVPVELSHFISKGLSKHPNERFQSIQEMQQTLEQIRGGYIKIQCPTTLLKRVIFALLHIVDRLPWLSYVLLVGSLALLANLLANALLSLF